MTLVDLRGLFKKKLCTHEEYEIYEESRKPIENAPERSVKTRRCELGASGEINRDYECLVNYLWIGEQVLSRYRHGKISLDEYDDYMKDSKQQRDERLKLGLPLSWNDYCDSLDSEEKKQRSYFVEEKPEQSFYDSYIDGKISPEDLVQFHKRKIAQNKLREFYKQGLCTFR